MRDISVLLTASGAPGAAALIRALRMNGERGVRVVGVDMSPQSIGRHVCDRF
jgi:ABC-type sugar transport system substrate-binding protein